MYHFILNCGKKVLSSKQEKYMYIKLNKNYKIHNYVIYNWSYKKVNKNYKIYCACNIQLIMLIYIIEKISISVSWKSLKPIFGY